MDSVDTQVQAQPTVEDATMTYQVQQRLLHIDTQMAQLQAQVERLITDASEANSQCAVLVRHMTDPHPLQGVCERLAELSNAVRLHLAQIVFRKLLGVALPPRGQVRRVRFLQPLDGLLAVGPGKATAGLRIIM